MNKMALRWSFTRKAAGLGLVIGACLISLPAAAQDCVVKIGTVGPMTGTGASWGLSERAGVEFEAAWTNEHGGLQVGNRKCTVTVIAVDGQQTVSGGAAASNYLASQGVRVINGPIVSPENEGFKPVAKRNGQVNFATSFAANVIGPDYPLAFHKTQSPPVWGTSVVKAAKDFYHITSAAMIGPNDQGGTDTIGPLVKLYNAAGVKTFPEYYQRGTTNFAPIVARVMGMEVDAVGALGRLGAGGDVVIANSGGVRAQKAFYWFDYVPTEDPGIQQLRTDFERVMKTKVPPNALWYNAQIATEVMLKAISIAGTDQDGEKVAEALRAMTPESRYLHKAGWRGKAQYGINQEFSFPVGVHFISNGKIVKELRLEIPSEN